MDSKPHQETALLPKVTLEKARLEISTVRVQMTLGLILIFTTCVAGYWSSFAGLPMQTINVLLLFVCCTFVSLTVLEITGLRGNRLGAAPAAWSGLLFAAYPGHTAAVTTIFGSVDLLCLSLYLVSVFCYLRFRLVRQPVYLIRSLLSYLLSLLIDAMAITVPAALCLVEILAGTAAQRRERQLQLWNRAKYLLPFWVALAAYGCARMGFHHTIGGGALNLQSLMAAVSDRHTLLKLVFPAGGQLALAGWVSPLLTAAYLGTLALALLRGILRTCPVRQFAILLLWALLMVLPALSIRHIFPDLYASRLFLFTSAPLCMLLALSALPATDTFSRRAAGITTVIGTLLLLSIFAGWSTALIYLNTG